MAQQFNVQNLTIQQIHQQIALCEQRIHQFTLLLSQITVYNHYFKYLDVIPQTAQLIEDWKNYKEALGKRLQDLI